MEDAYLFKKAPLNLRIFLLIVLIIQIYSGYVGGRPTEYILLDVIYIISDFLSLIIFFKIVLLTNSKSDSNYFILVTYLYITIKAITYTIRIFSNDYNGTFLFYLAALTLILSTIYTYNILVKKNALIAGDSIREDNTVEDKNTTNKQETTPIVNSSIDKVISSIENRASSAEKSISNSLIIMVVLVFIGGGTTIGTLAFSKASKVRELEIKRIELIEISDSLNKIHSDFSTNSIISDTAKFRSISKQLNNIKISIDKKFGQKNTYKDVLDNIQRSEIISWEDIAIRITIAALTLFLIQIFFHIYKYNQQQASSLRSKAEVLILFNESGADLNDLRNGLLSKLSTEAKFGKDPTTPTEQIINIIDGVRR